MFNYALYLIKYICIKLMKFISDILIDQLFEYVDFVDDYQLDVMIFITDQNEFIDINTMAGTL